MTTTHSSIRIATTETMPHAERSTAQTSPVRFGTDAPAPEASRPVAFLRPVMVLS